MSFKKFDEIEVSQLKRDTGAFKEPVKYFCQCCNVYMGPGVGSHGRMNGRLHDDGMRYYCWNCWYGWELTPYCNHCYSKQQEQQRLYEEELEKKHNDTDQLLEKFNKTEGTGASEPLVDKDVKQTKLDEKQKKRDKVNQRLVKLGLKSKEELLNTK